VPSQPLDGKPGTSITVVSPARNATRYYSSWLQSIEAQEYQKLEVILVDDGSDDYESPSGLRAVAQTAPDFLRYVRLDGCGPAAARNSAIELSSGAYVAFLDLDDLWTRGHLGRLSSALDEHPDAGIAQGLIRNFITNPDGELYYCSEAYRFVNLGAALYRREVFDQCGLLDPSLQFGEDFDLFVRCWERGIRKIEVPAVSLLYHRHEDNLTKGKSIVDLGAVRIYKRRIDRLRANLVDASLVTEQGVSYASYLGRTVDRLPKTLGELVEL
jgi:glycosyltransferase involved in cell wall biosynthesis